MYVRQYVKKQHVYFSQQYKKRSNFDASITATQTSEQKCQFDLLWHETACGVFAFYYVSQKRKIRTNFPPCREDLSWEYLSVWNSKPWFGLSLYQSRAGWIMNSMPFQQNTPTNKFNEREECGTLNEGQQRSAPRISLFSTGYHVQVSPFTFPVRRRRDKSIFLHSLTSRRVFSCDSYYCSFVCVHIMANYYSPHICYVSSVPLSLWPSTFWPNSTSISSAALYSCTPKVIYYGSSIEQNAGWELHI